MVTWIFVFLSEPFSFLIALIILYFYSQRNDGKIKRNK
jgi:hypothetical protein